MDVEGTMQFLLEQQAGLSVRLEQLTARVEQLTESHELLARSQLQQQEALGQVIGVVQDLAIAHQQLAEGTERRFGELADALRQTNERVQTLTERVQTLTERVQTLTENMNALIRVVDGLVRRGGPPT